MQDLFNFIVAFAHFLIAKMPKIIHNSSYRIKEL